VAEINLPPQNLSLPAYANKIIVLKGNTPTRTVANGGHAVAYFDTYSVVARRDISAGTGDDPGSPYTPGTGGWNKSKAL
jgi:hypothetical protein